MAERRAFVCGHPVKHSRSPLIHNHWLKHYAIGGSYEALDIAPTDFETFAGTLQAAGYSGGNVTIPNKEYAYRAARRRTVEAEQIGAVNTLWFEDGVLNGTNTDAYGFLANLDQIAAGWDAAKSAVVLGAGGAARAVVFALKQRGFRDIRIMNRTVDRARELADAFGARAYDLASAAETMRGASLVVNTTALGMDGDSGLPANPAWIDAEALVTDIVYVPIETPFLAAAREHGLRTADGLGMLLHQAVPGFELWFGKRPEVTEQLRALIVADIGKH